MVIILEYDFILFDMMMKDNEGIKGTALLFSVFLASMTLGTLLMFLLDKRKEREMSISRTTGEHSSVKICGSPVAGKEDASDHTLAWVFRPAPGICMVINTESLS